MKPENNLLAQILLCVFASTALAGMAQDFLPQNYSESLDHPWMLEKINPDDDWTRHFRIGGMAGFNIKANFSMSGTFSSAALPTGIYDDGYVLEDDQQNAGGISFNWGYNNASQVSGNTILMHQATSFSVGDGNSSSGNSPLAGLDIAYGDSYWYWQHAKLGWEFGFGFLPINVSGTASVTANRNVLGFDANIVPSPPPYQGSADSSGEGSYVNTTPSVTSTDIIAGKTSESLDVMLYTARLGPTLYWDLSEKVGLYAGAGPAVGLVSGDLKASGIVSMADGTTAHYKANSISSTSITYGGYANATLVYHAVEGGDFYLGAQFMPMSSATISGGGRMGKLDLSGQVYITAGINWPF